MDWKKFRNPQLIADILQLLQSHQQPLRLMEVCGTHTMAIGHWGIRKLLPATISLISGPGCPVCVTPTSLIDALIELKSVTIATFGDLIRVPGNYGSLELARARGLQVKVIYSPLEALELAEKREVILVGIGFETTIPGMAQTLIEARRRNLKNFSLLPAFKTIPPALRALLKENDVQIDGFLLPGHVSVIIGLESYRFMTQEFGIGGIITGFEPLDIVTAIYHLALQQENSPRIENEYRRCVSDRGNRIARDLMEQVLEVQDAPWRGLGWIPGSGLGIRAEFAEFDASRKYGITLAAGNDPPGCRCGDVLKGKIIPPECPLFARVCQPENPIGPCMVSSEGSCAAYYKYEQ
ncbi:MAG: hydrogenase formation protein HypD [Candidatus Cloacimonetes bacterium]|nr:hydrogenase formation protein HypD [Candidatus Cloacimonadota bacterium]